MTRGKTMSRVLCGGVLVLVGFCAVAASARAEESKAASDSNGAAAADPNAPQPAPGEPERVQVQGKLPYVPTSNTIATRLPVPLRETPANVGTVNEQLMREQYDVVLGDALRNVSGVNVATLSDVVDFFSIRGFDSVSSALVLTDGAPEPEATFYQTYNVERIEVLKGPGGFLYGRDPLAGAVNIVRQQPLAGTFGRVGLTYGSFNTTDATADFNTSTKSGKLAFRINSTWRQSDFYRDDMYNRNLAVNPALTWRFSDRASINFNLEYVDTSYSPDAGLPIFNGEIAEVPREREYQSPFDFSDQQIGRAQVDFESLLGERWTLRNKTYYRDLDWESDGTLFSGVFPNFGTGRPEVNRFLTLLDDRQQFVGNRFEATLKASTGKVEHKVLLGTEVTSYGDEFTLDVATLPAIDLEDPVETAAPPLIFIPGQSTQGDSEAFVYAPFAIDQIRFNDQWHVMAGARWDVIDYEDKDAPQLDRRDSEVSPTLGVVYTPGSVVSYYASAGSSFAPPSPRVTEVREPERSRQYEAGAKMTWMGGKLQSTVAGYHIERENIGIPDANGFTQQIGDQRSQGIEADLTAELAKGLRGFISYAYNDSELTSFSERIVVGVDPNFNPIFGTVDRSDNGAAFAPRNILNVWVSKRFDSGFGVGGGPRWVSDQFIAADNAFAIDEYITVDAALFYERGDWEWTLNMKNLTGTEYETVGFGNTSVIPAAKFAAYGGARYRF